MKPYLHQVTIRYSVNTILLDHFEDGIRGWDLSCKQDVRKAPKDVYQ